MYTAKLSTGTTGRVAVSASPLGRGGEGSVFSIDSIELDSMNASELVAKIYHDPTEGNREAKIDAMLASPPESDSVAWPLASLQKDGAFVGYLMAKLPPETYRSWADLSNSKSRRKVAPKFDVRYAIVASENLGIAIKSIHDAGHCVGDINESNILVAADSRVMIVDTDSAQITDADGTIFPCTVGKQEYTSPELTRGSFRDQKRTRQSDVYAYAVAVYQMLTGGAHPTDSRYNGNDDPPSVVEKIRKGIYPGLVDVPSQFSTLPRIPVSAIPLVYKNVIKKSLAINPSDRPEFAAILNAEAGCRGHLVQCAKVKTHWYDSREKSCPWCVNASKPGAVDPWGDGKPKATPNKQASLPALSFNDEDDSPTIRRAPVSTSPSRTAAQSPYSTSGPQTAGPPASGASSSFPPGFGASQNSIGSGIPQGQTQTPQGTQPPQQQTSPPQSGNSGKKRKHKGKTILNYADGTQGPRPPLSELFRSNPKLAISCFFDELPGFAKFWWPSYRGVAAWWASIIGLLFGLGVSFGWLIVIPKAQVLTETWKASEHAQVFLAGSAIIASVTATIGVTILFISTLVDAVKAKKNLPAGYTLTMHNPALVILQFVTVSIATGPLLIVSFLVLALFVALKIFFALAEGIFSPSSSRSRR